MPQVAGKEVKWNQTYIWNLEDVKRVLYRLPQLIETPTQEWTYICEGEKDADRLADMGLVATTSGSSTSWKKDYNEYFKDRLVAVCPDNDTAGKIFADKVSESLYGTAAEIRVLELPGLLDGEDVSDWMDNGGDILLLEEVLKDTKPYVYIEPADIEPVLISLDSVKPVAVDWLWEKRIPKAAEV